MKANELARRALYRVVPVLLAERLHRFLSEPRNVGTPRYKRVLEILEQARKRKGNGYGRE